MMPNAAATAAAPSLYQTLALYLLILVAAIFLFILVRVLISRFPGGQRKGLRIFLVRLTLPAIFSLALFALKMALSIPPALKPYVDAGLVFFTFFFLIRLFDAALQGWYSRTSKAFPLPDVLHSLTLGVLYIIVLFVVLKNVLSINITPFLATSAILTMVIGLALQGVLSNILSGMSLHFSKSFNRGDWVAIGDLEGIVMDTNWRETRLLDRASNIVVLPNNIVSNERITNFSQPDMRTALLLNFKISAAAPASRVLEALKEAARDCAEVVVDPAPIAYLQSYDELGVSYQLKFWVTDFGRKHPILTEVGRLAWYKLARRGIAIAMPLGDRVGEFLAATQGKPALPAAPARRADEEENFSVLLQSAFLRFQEGEKAGQLMVPEDDVQALAAAAQRSVYGTGEILCRQGDKGRSAYIVMRGRIRGEIVTHENEKRYVSAFSIGPGGIFGEMSLFTGMPRTATGIVEEEAELLKIKAADFALVLGKNPDLAEVIADLVAARNEQNKEFLLKIKELTEKDVRDSTNKKSILEYLKRFVGLRR